MVRLGSKRTEGTPEAHTGDVPGKGVRYVMAASGRIQYDYKQTNNLEAPPKATHDRTDAIDQQFAAFSIHVIKVEYEC
jgi:hypothetical protein